MTAPTSHRHHLSRGFNWLGIATITARIVDFAIILVVLRFLDKTQFGHAAIILSFGMVIEALAGLGCGDALVQAQTLDRRQTDTLFWYALGVGFAAAAAALLAGPLIGHWYGFAAAPLMAAIAVKQPAVAAAAVPLALMNRELRYRRIAAINLAATLGAAAIRLVLAMSGAGAWALVLGYVASGLLLLAGVAGASHWKPRLTFDPGAARPLMRFGLRSATANIAEQGFRNVDFLLVGGFYGPAALAIYRLAFDVAMEPTMAVGTLVNRVALPVFARVSDPAARADVLAWSLRRVLMLVAPLMAGLMLAAGPLTRLVHDSQGLDYARAALPLRILAAAALLRVTSQLLPAVMLVRGAPGDAARLAAATLAALAAGVAVIGLALPAASGIPAVAALWLALYPPVLIWGFFYLRRHWSVPPRRLALALRPAAIGVVLMAACVLLAWQIAPSGPRMRLGLAVLGVALCYAGLAAGERMARDARPG